MEIDHPIMRLVFLRWEMKTMHTTLLSIMRTRRFLIVLLLDLSVHTGQALMKKDTFQAKEGKSEWPGSVRVFSIWIQ